jgi:hypothetical protein
MEMFWIELEIESKDSLLAQIWHSIELILFKPCILGVGYLWSCWLVSLAEIYVLKLYIDVILQVYSLSLSSFQREPLLRLAFLGQYVVPDSSSIPTFVKCFVLYLPLELYNRIWNLNWNKVKFSEHFNIIFLYVMYYTSLLR